jgi:hypothetical protein
MPILIDMAAGFAQTNSGFYTLNSIEIVHVRDSFGGAIYGSDSSDTISFDEGFSQATIVGRGGDDVLIGGPGNDLIEGDSGNDTLTGGSGSDTFVYRGVLDGADIITDFTPGSGGDVLDFADILASGGYTGSTPIHDGYVRFVPSGNDAVFQIDLDGPGTGAQFKTLATLKGVAPSALLAANFASTVDVGATSPGTGPITSDWSQSLTYQRDQAVVPLGNMVVDPDPNTQLIVQLVLADPTVGALSAANGAVYDPITGTWSVQGTEAQVNVALASVSFEPYAVRQGDTTISTFVTDGTNAPVAGLITLGLLKTPIIINGTDGDDNLIAQSGDNLIFGGLGHNEVDYRLAGQLELRSTWRLET